jgi:Uma2 family endonuclease
MAVGTETPITLDHHELPPHPVRRFTVEEFLWMVEAGVFARNERFELLEGWIIPTMTRNPPHEVTIVLVQDGLRGPLPPGWHIRTQASTRTPDSVPEPDLAIVRGAARDYLKRHPGPQDTALVVEVADSSLAEDRGIKLRLYARAGYPIYWIVNLIVMMIEVYTDPTGPDATPTYRTRRDYGVDDVVPLVIDGREVGRIAARDLLP